MRVYCFLIVGWFILSTCVYGTTFTQPLGLINIPIAEQVNRGDYVVGAYMGIFNSEVSEVDVMFAVSPMKQTMLSLVMLTPYNYSGQFHYTIYNNKYFGIATGILHISNKKEAQTWDTYTQVEDVQYSQYLVTRTTIGFLHLHLGYGNKRFTKFSDKLDKKNGTAFFYGVGLSPDSKINLMMEFDGKDYHAGLSIPLSNGGAFKVAMTELFLERDRNPNYNNMPVRFVNLGVNFSGSIFKKERDSRYLESTLSEAKKMYQELTQYREKLQVGLNEVSEKKQKLISTIETLEDAVDSNVKTESVIQDDKYDDSQKLNAKIIELYYKSYESYSKRDYNESLQYLQEALVLDPTSVQIYIRLGSIYYALEKYDEAVTVWEKAYQMDPSNQQIKALLGLL
jgi:tetratricopeptide (TPR) repeat protein